VHSSSSSVVTCKELSSQCTTAGSIRHVESRSVQADDVDVGQPTCRAASVADAAVEVGESLLASSSQWHNCEIAHSSSAVTLPSVISVSVQTNPGCITSMTAAARHSGLYEPLPDRTLDFQNTACHQQIEHTASAEQLHNHNVDHIAESSPVIVIVPDENASPSYQLTCDEHSSCEKSGEVSKPLDSLAQSMLLYRVSSFLAFFPNGWEFLV